MLKIVGQQLSEIWLEEGRTVGGTAVWLWFNSVLRRLFCQKSIKVFALLASFFLSFFFCINCTHIFCFWTVTSV